MAEHRSGFVALVGRPNAGKSTLLNCLLGQKVSIVSARPQTTRNRLVGIYTADDLQAVLVDTPGLHEPTTPLNKAMVRVAEAALGEVDAICWVVDAARSVRAREEGRPVFHRGLEHVAGLVRASPAAERLTIALNKVDLVRKHLLLPVIEEFAERFPAAEIVPISALQADGVDRIVDTWRARLPEGPPLYPPDMVTDAPERFVVAEIVREKVFRLTRQEVPYSTAVEIERFEEEPPRRPDGPGLVRIFARILVERPSQKAIVIGKGGRMLKRIGTQAREDTERLLGARVYLELHVSVRPDWTRDPRALRQLVGLE